MNIDFEQYRRKDKSISLHQALGAYLVKKYAVPTERLSDPQINFLMSIEELRPITSRQMAALILAIAETL